MKKVTISKRAFNTPASPIRKLQMYARQVKKRGVSILHLNIGQPDLQPPPIFFKELKRFVKESVAYAPSEGYHQAIHAWQKYYRSYNIKLKEDEIIITAGGSEAILFSLLACADPGDDILVFEPLYTNYISYACMAGVRLTPVKLLAEIGYHLPDAATIARKITPRTKAIVVTNPCNPTGAVYSKAELQVIVDVAYKYGLYIIADEVYREFIFNGVRHVSLMEFPKVRDRTIMIDSVSKRFNLCGARIGCVASKNKKIMQNILKFAQGRLSAPSLEQLAIVSLLKNSRKYTKPLAKEYNLRKDIVAKMLCGLPNVQCSSPEGAFYILANLPVDDADRFSQWLLKDFSYRGETVMLAPASGFYITKGFGIREVRIAYVLNRTKLKRAMEILQRALAAYNKNN
jgi:aspartate aminotransferase